MADLPLGSVQTHPVPVELLNYDGIAGIEFIEANPDVPAPRSAAYRPVDGGGQLRLRNQTPDLVDLDLSEEQARGFVDAFARSGVFGWKRVYRPVQGTFVLADTEWRLKVAFRAQGGEEPRPFESEGSNVFPDGYEDVVALLLRGL